MGTVSRVLISVSDKAGIVEFAKYLADHGAQILSTGGTSAVLKKAQIPVTDVAEFTGSPEILDGRVKTLHPKIHGGILGRRSDPKHIEQMMANGIGPIDMVVVNLYPFEDTVAKPGCAFDDAIENIDIGGPSMLRSAAKNFGDVSVVTDPADYESVIAEMSSRGGELTKETRFRLAKKAFALTARYDCAIASYLSRHDDAGSKLEWPTKIGFTFDLVQPLRYGENPHQGAAFYRDVAKISEPSIVNAKQLGGKELSYNNIMDADAALEIIKEFKDSKFAAVIVKHANPCGAAVSQASLDKAFSKALACDPTSAFGGIIAFNSKIDASTAKEIASSFYEVVVAPDFESAALELLKAKKNLRLIEIPALNETYARTGLSFRKVVGGLLLQSRDTSSEDVRSSRIVTKRAPTDSEWAGLEFAWRICKHVKSNAIVYASSDRTLGIGAGQMSRVDSSKIAVLKSRTSLKGSVVASDAFFPFPDGVEAAADAGATAVIQPGGSVKDDEVIAMADSRGMAMVFTGVRHFRH